MLKQTKIKIAIYVVLGVIAITALTFWIIYNSQRARDFQRLGDMRVLQEEMNNYYFRFNTYQIPECALGSVISSCKGVGEQEIQSGKLVDPTNSGNFRYVVKDLTDTNFRVEFYLETGIAGLTNGRYVVTREGLGR